MRLPMQHIYFDPDDEEVDGYGWNVVDYGTDTGIAARFPTCFEAVRFCELFGFEYRFRQ